MEKILTLNERVRHQIQRYIADSSTPNTLTQYAMSRFMDAQNQSREGGSHAMQCAAQSTFAATVRYASENYHTATVYSVDLSRKQCSYNKWQQTGIPCKHACYFMTMLGMESDHIFTEGYLSSICFTEHWRMFYSHPIMTGSVPGDDEIEIALVTINSPNDHMTVVAKLTDPSEDNTRITKKRLRGSDEKSTRASLPPSAMKGRRICVQCGKHISQKTKHDWKACANFRKKNWIAWTLQGLPQAMKLMV